MLHQILAKLYTLCILSALIKAFQRPFAILSLFFLLHAITPGAFFGLSLIDDDSRTVAQTSNPMAEEEEDENSDLNLKFLQPVTSTALPVLIVSFPKPDEIPISGFVEEIPTPPPLS